jgi:hypothetical protein
MFATSPNILSSKGGLEILGDVLHRLAALPVRAKAPLVLVALVERGASVSSGLQGMIVAGLGGKRRA